MSDSSFEKAQSNSAATRVQCNNSTSNPSFMEVTPSAATRVQHTRIISNPSAEEFASLRQQLQASEQEVLELETLNNGLWTMVNRSKKAATQSAAFDHARSETMIKELKDQLHAAELFQKALESRLLAAESSRQEAPGEEQEANFKELQELLAAREHEFQGVCSMQDDLIREYQDDIEYLTRRNQELEQRDPQGEMYRMLYNNLESAYKEVEILVSTVKKSNSSLRASGKELDRLQSAYDSLYDEHKKAVEYHNWCIAQPATLSVCPRIFSKHGRPDKSDQVSDTVPSRSKLSSVRSESSIEESMSEIGSQVGEPSENIRLQDPPLEHGSPILEEVTEPVSPVGECSGVIGL